MIKYNDTCFKKSLIIKNINPLRYILKPDFNYFNELSKYSVINVVNSIHYEARVKFNQLHSQFIQAQPLLKEEFYNHCSQSSQKIHSFVKSYLLSFFVLSSIIDPLISNKFLAVAVKMIISPLLLNEISQKEFIDGIKEAIIGPALAYWFTLVIPTQYSLLTTYVIKCIIRTICIRILFPSENDTALEFFRFLPGLMLAGSIRGFIMHRVDVLLQDYRLSDNDIFNWSMIGRYIFEPQVKKCENFSFF